MEALNFNIVFVGSQGLKIVRNYKGTRCTAGSAAKTRLANPGISMTIKPKRGQPWLIWYQKAQPLQSLQALKWCSCTDRCHGDGGEGVLFDLKLLQLIFNADLRSRLRSEKWKRPNQEQSLAGSNLALRGKGKGMVSVKHWVPCACKSSANCRSRTIFPCYTEAVLKSNQSILNVKLKKRNERRKKCYIQKTYWNKID